MVNHNLALKHDNILNPEISINETPLKWCTVSLSDVLSRGSRLDASMFDVEAKQARKLIETGKYPLTAIGGETGLASSYTCGRFKRIWVQKSNFPIYQPSTILDIKPTPDGYISELTKTNIEALRVHSGQVLMTCSGTIGNISYVSKTLDNCVFSHDLLRINCKKSCDAGYVYAYLKSKIGHKILLTNSYGAVITHIEPEHLATVPIPDAPVMIKNKINDLIVRSYALRDESNNLFDEATQLLVNELQLPPIRDLQVNYFKKDAAVDTFSVKLSNIAGRVDASYHVPVVDAITAHLQKYAEEVTTIGDDRISKRVILPGRFKRVYVNEGYGVTFFGGRSIGELDPTDKKYLSFAQHNKKIKDELTIRQNMILVTCSGTVGKVAFVPKHWDGYAMTHDIIRLVPREGIEGYEYIWLQSEYAALLMRAQEYGSVVLHIEKEHICSLPIPLLKNHDIQKRINNLALQANQKRFEAYQMEQKALTIMDNEVLYAK